MSIDAKELSTESVDFTLPKPCKRRRIETTEISLKGLEQEPHRLLLFSQVTNQRWTVHRDDWLDQYTACSGGVAKLDAVLDDLKRANLIQETSANKYSITTDGLQFAYSVQFDIASSDLSDKRQGFDELLTMECDALARIDIESDGNCMQRALCEGLGVPQKMHHALRSYLITFIICNRSLFASLFEKIKANECGVEMSDEHPIKTFNQWLSRNKHDKWYDHYGRIWLLAAQLCFSCLITMTDGKNQPIYPIQFEDFHSEAVEQVAKDDFWDFAKVRLVKLGNHYEVVKGAYTFKDAMVRQSMLLLTICKLFSIASRLHDANIE